MSLGVVRRRAPCTARHVKILMDPRRAPGGAGVRVHVRSHRLFQSDFWTASSQARQLARLHLERPYRLKEFLGPPGQLGRGARDRLDGRRLFLGG